MNKGEGRETNRSGSGILLETMECLAGDGRYNHRLVDPFAHLEKILSSHEKNSLARWDRLRPQ